ncbi:MAG: hypothetical protein ACREAF_04940 [Nitrosopumilaceae archaeon]
MTSKFVKHAVMIGSAGVVAVAILYSVGLVDSCPTKHAGIVNDLNKYHKTLDPEFCEELVTRIIELNEECGIEIEILDCG